MSVAVISPLFQSLPRRLVRNRPQRPSGGDSHTRVRKAYGEAYGVNETHIHRIHRTCNDARLQSTCVRQTLRASNKLIQYPATLTEPTKRLLRDSLLLSWLAYSDPASINQSFPASRQAGTDLKDASQVLKWVDELPLFVTSPESDAQCYLVRYNPPSALDISTKPVLAICARGTTSFMDWVCDAQVRQVPFRDSTDQIAPGIQVHRGFYRQFIGLFSKIDKIVKSHLQSGGNLLCVGHSLGSSLATIASLNYGRQYPRQVFYVGCGTPRVGNQAFADDFDQCVQLRYRLKNARDPVCSIIPPLGYAHVGQEMHLGAADPIPDVPIMTDVTDHYISHYVETLDTCLLLEATQTQRWYQKLLSHFKM